MDIIQDSSALRTSDENIHKNRDEHVLGPESPNHLDYPSDD